jgi:DNA-binding SARP family transcriptional activator
VFAFQLGNAFHEAGRDDEAFAALSMAALSPPCWETAMIGTILALTLCARGELEQARSAGEFALSTALELGDPTPETEAHIALALVARQRDGYPAAEAHLAAALDAAEREGNLSGLCRGRAVRGCLAHEQGRYREALSEFDVALRLTELNGYGSFQSQLLCRRGRARLACGRLEEALSDFKEAAAAGERRGSSRTGEAYAGLGDVYRERGDASLATAAYEHALGRLGADTASSEVVAVLSGLARVVAEESPERGRLLAEEALALAETCPPTGALLPAGWVSRAHEPQALARLACGWLALKRGDVDTASALGAELSERATACGDRALLAEALELRAASQPDVAGRSRLLEEALATWHDLEAPVGEARCRLALVSARTGAAAERETVAAEERLRAFGVRPNATPAGLLAVIPGGTAAPVVIETLGSFRVTRNGQPLYSGEWRSKKARDLLKLLVARRGRPSPREALMETFWPGEEGAKVANRLSVALSTIRSLVDPENVFEPGHFVATGESGVRLELAHLDVDVEAFITGATAGLALYHDGRVDEARSVLLRAQAMYGGEFLEDEPYQDWAVALREEARNLFIEVSRRLAEDAEAHGDPDAAVRHLLRILERDAYDEQAHLAVVSAHIAAGRHGDARRAFGIYTARMDELGLESAPFPRAGARGPH